MEEQKELEEIGEAYLKNREEKKGGNMRGGVFLRSKIVEVRRNEVCRKEGGRNQVGGVC